MINWEKTEFSLLGKILAFEVGETMEYAEGVPRKAQLATCVKGIFPYMSERLFGVREDLVEHIRRTQNRQVSDNSLYQRWDKQQRYHWENPENNPAKRRLLDAVQEQISIAKGDKSIADKPVPQARAKVNPLDEAIRTLLVSCLEEFKQKIDKSVQKALRKIGEEYV